MIRLACASLSCDGFGDNDFINTFKLLPKIGYKYVELNCWHPGTLTPQKMNDLNERFKKSGLLPSSIHGSSIGGDSSEELTKDVTHKIRMMESAREIGCAMISATGYSRGTKKGLDGIITVLKEIVPAAEQWGIRLSLENHVGNNLENIDDYKYIFDQIDSPLVGICLDTGHFDAANVNISDLIKTFGKRINHIHLKENKGKGEKVFTKFGEGTTDNHQAIKDMLALGYSGYLVVELSPEIKSGQSADFPIEDLITPYNMFRQYEKED